MSNMLELTEETFDQETSQPGLTVVDFWAPWCGPCRAMAPQIERAAGLRPQYRFAKVNVDDNPTLPAQYGVRGIPALFMFKGGEVVSNRTGAAPKASLKGWIEETV